MSEKHIHNAELEVITEVDYEEYCLLGYNIA
jgi:hypothetical protein